MMLPRFALPIRATTFDGRYRMQVEVAANRCNFHERASVHGHDGIAYIVAQVGGKQYGWVVRYTRASDGSELYQAWNEAESREQALVMIKDLARWLPAPITVSP